MTITRRAALALPGLALLPRPARAAFPDRPIRIIVPFAAGTSSDFQARMIGERMAPLLRQPVIVENRAGAGGVVGADAVAKAAPDGYTLLLGSNGPLTNAPVLQARLPYDPVYVAKLGGGQVDTASGDFVFGMTEAYLIENGQITEPLRDGNLIGNGPQVLRDIDLLGNDFAMGNPGTCGKDGQGVPVGDGQPTLRVKSMTIGGTAA